MQQVERAREHAPLVAREQQQRQRGEHEEGRGQERDEHGGMGQENQP